MKARWVWTILIFLGTMWVTMAASENQGGSSTKSRTFTIPNHGSLILNLPASWKQHIDRSQNGLPPTIELTPKSGDEFTVLITPLYGSASTPDYNKSSGLKRLIDNDLKQMLPSAVEKQVAIQEIKGAETVGYYYCVTDKAPKPGEYPYALRAVAGVGDLLLSVTVLYRTKDSDGVAGILRALEQARQEARQ